MTFKSTVFIVLLLATYSFASELVKDAPKIPSSSDNAVVHDADTLRVNNIKYRLYGIDAPELNQTCWSSDRVKYKCGVYSRDALVEFINNKPVTCTSNSKDRYGREIGTCYLGNLNINAWLVENGYAIAYREYSKDFIEQEDSAKAMKLGIWQGDFVEPSIFRKSKRKHR